MCSFSKKCNFKRNIYILGIYEIINFLLTCRFLSSLILVIWIFLRPIFAGIIREITDLERRIRRKSET